MSHLTSLQNVKALLRKEIKGKIKLLSKSDIKAESEFVTRKLLSHPQYVKSRAVAVFLSMPDEIDTSAIIEDIFHSGKQCYIPRYNEDGSNFMTMIRIHTLMDLQNLPRTKWNIPQPKVFDMKDDCLTIGGLDLVLVPGLGFTQNGHRLGRGKGFYDNFLLTYKEKFGPLFTIGLALKECVLEEIPVCEKDVLIDEVLFA